MRSTRTLSIKVRPSIQSLMHRRLFVDFLVDLSQPIILINYHRGAVAIKLRSSAYCRETSVGSYCEIYIDRDKSESSK